MMVSRALKTQGWPVRAILIQSLGVSVCLTCRDSPSHCLILSYIFYSFTS